MIPFPIIFAVGRLALSKTLGFMVDIAKGILSATTPAIKIRPPQLYGTTRVEWHGEKVMAKVEQIIDEVSRETAWAIQREAKRNLKSKVKHSTGSLASSIKAQKSQFKGGGYIVRAGGGSTKDYASFVELGSYKQEAKPFLRPAMKANKRKFYKHLKDRLK